MQKSLTQRNILNGEQFASSVVSYYSVGKHFHACDSMSTEKTPLTDSAARTALNYPYYGNNTGTHQFYTRRRKEQQLQCITFVIIIAIFIMALVITVSYSINKMDPLVGDSTNPEVVPPSPSLKATWSPGASNKIYSTSLTTEEWTEAAKAGGEAISSREAADALATPLAAPSPDSRHQYAVKTSLQAGKLALGGIGELAATRSIEQARAKLGAPSSVGSYFKNIWIPKGTCKEFTKVTCPPSKYRNFDGTCNHPRNLGAALSPFVRKLPPAYADGVDAPRVGKFGRALPSAREISLKVHPPAPSSNPAFTVMLAVFGQFLDHDMTATAISQGTNGSSLTCCPATTHPHPECFPVAVGPGDPVYDVAGRDCMEFVRSAPAPQCKIGPREQLNQVTAFIDASVIYGPDLVTAQTLREGQGGALRMFKTADNRTLLPQSTNPNDGCNREVESARGRYCFASGDGRANENLHLTTMHLLWARQHNRIAAALAEINPSWGDEKIYQEARRIIGAQLQHIAYKEFVPIVLGEKEVGARRLKPLMSGFRPKNDSAEVDPAIANSFAAAAFRFAHTLLPGLMKVTDSQKATSSYVELHRMLFNPYSLYNKGGMESSLTTATSNLIQKTTTHVTSQLTKHLFEDPLSNATIPCGLDLVSLNIQRGRDHGLPGYNDWRQYCGLGKVATFAELTGELEPDSLDEISKVYEHVDDVDLYTGALAESDKGDGLVGPTFRCIIGDQFSRIQQGDRFWYEVPGEPQSFTKGQLKEIRRTSLAKLICDCSDGIDHIQPEVMRSVGPENPVTSCEDIAGPDFTAWKDPSSPQILKAIPAADMPETWLNFKTTINNTVQEIVDFFSKTVPAPGSPDWATFKNWVNKSFSDIRSELSSLHPKPLQSIAGVPPSQDNKKEIYSQLLKAKKSSKDFVKKAANINYMQFAMNRSLTDINEYTKTAATQPMTYEDWISFKDDIKKSLNDALVNATGTPTAEQREELKKQIVAEIEDIKSRIASVGATKLYLPKEGTTADPAATADWLSFKIDVVKAVTDAIDRIKAKAPPPGDPTWATFGLDIKKQFTSMKEYIPVLPTVKVAADDPSGAAYWDNLRDSLNKSISSAVAGIGGSMPAPGDPAWAAFSAKIMKDFTQFRNKFEGKPKVKAPAPGNVVPFDWIKFKTEIIKSVADTVNEMKKNMPAPGSPAWTAFRSQIMNGFAKIPNEVPSVQRTAAEPATGAKPRETDTFDWMTLKKDINKSVSDIIDGGAIPTNLPLGDPKWAAFGAKFAKFNKTFEIIKSEIDALRPKPEVAQFQLLTKDWVEFRAKIKKSLTDAIDSMQFKAPALVDPGWLSFRDAIKDEFAALKKEIAIAKSEGLMAADISQESILPSSSAKEGFYFPELPSHLFSLQAKANKTLLQLKKSIVEMKLGATAPVISAADWIAFKQEFNDAVANFVSARNAGAAEEWIKMRDSVKKSFADLSAQIASLRNMTGILQQKSQVPAGNVVEVLKGKEVKDLTKDGKLLASSENLFDWVKLKTDINATIHNLLNDLGKIVPDKTPSKTLKGSLVKAQNKFANLQLPPSLTAQPVLPDDWAVFVNGINKTLSGVMKKIDALKPVDKTDSVALESYEKEVDDFFEKVKEVVEKKKSEFAAATSMASRTMGLKMSPRNLVTSLMILSVWIIAVF